MCSDCRCSLQTPPRHGESTVSPLGDDFRRSLWFLCQHTWCHSAKLSLSCSLSVVVEDVSSSACVTVKVFPYMTVAALKQQVSNIQGQKFPHWYCFILLLLTRQVALGRQVFFEYGFHPRVQRWIIGQCLCTDQRSLASYGVQKDGDTAYLYLISARQARITRQLFQQDLESALLGSTVPPGNSATSQDRRGYSTLPSRLPHNNQGEWKEFWRAHKVLFQMYHHRRQSPIVMKSLRPHLRFARRDLKGHMISLVQV